MISFPLCQYIKTTPAIKTDASFHFPKVSVQMLRELLADPMWVAYALSFNWSYSAYSSFNTPDTGPPTQMLRLLDSCQGPCTEPQSLTRTPECAVVPRSHARRTDSLLTVIRGPHYHLEESYKQNLGESGAELPNLVATNDM